MEQHRPHTTVVLAMSADGKIADLVRVLSVPTVQHLPYQIQHCCNREK